MTIKKIVCASLLAVSLSSISVLSYASKLTIVNNTNQYSTSTINDSFCSSKLGDIGITPPKQTRIVGAIIVRGACGLNPSNCKADVYMTDHCGDEGAQVATVLFDVDKGIKSISMHSQDYKITGSGFTIQLDGGPAVASK